jgi:formiminotetrahydrofolate cyclodeaminase
MSARLSTDHLPEATALSKRADRFRNEVAPLAWADAEAYGRVLAARRTQGKSVQEALSEAADVPLAVAEAGAEVSRIAARLVKEGNPNLVGDAITAVLLAEAGVHAATRLVRINLSDGAIEDRRRLSRADELVRTASSARRVVEGKARARSIRQR